jgi:SAM-dependent methyltransferase
VTHWDPASYDARHGFIHGLAGGVVDLLDPQPGERILDAGSGTGHLAAQIAARGAEVVGIDASAAMVEAARARYPELRFEVADLRSWRTPETYDAVFSNATLHWILQPSAAIDTIARALRPGGRFVAEFGGHGNVERLTTALREAVGEATGRVPPPFWYFPALGAYALLLEAHGLAVTDARLFERPTPLAGGEAGLANWYREFCTHVLEPVPADERERVLARAAALARDRWVEGQWIADYVRLRIRAVKRVPPVAVAAAGARR